MFDLLWNGCTSIGTLKLHFSQRLQYLSLFWLRHLCRIQIPVKSRLFHINVVHPILHHPNFTINGWYHPPQSWRCMPYCIRFLAVFDGESGPCSTPHRLDFKLEFLWPFQVFTKVLKIFPMNWVKYVLPTISLVMESIEVGYSLDIPILDGKLPTFFYHLWGIPGIPSRHHRCRSLLSSSVLVSVPWRSKVFMAGFFHRFIWVKIGIL